MKTKLYAFIPLVILIVIGLFFAIELRKGPSKMPSVMINRPMPEFVLQPILEDQEPFAFSDLSGQVSLVNIFGSWCAACVVEHPVLMRLAHREGVAIYGVAWRDTAIDASNWLQKYGNPYRKIGLDAESLLAIDLGVTGAPETFLVDKSGNIRFKQVGPISNQAWEQTIKPMILLLEAEE
ncbi:MAG: DsbE family thiol:disulfide interchange protein [Robiginitomaculum sp.]|nr:DsbE family thiol:disulfide interchange protein [Robiginitomaculum sp.]